MIFLAFLRDSLRETIDKKSFWILASICIFFVLLCFSISFTPLPPEAAFQEATTSFNVVMGPTFLRKRFDKMRFEVSNCREVPPDALFKEARYEFSLKLKDEDALQEFYEAIWKESALERDKTKEEGYKDPKLDVPGMTKPYPAPSEREQVKYLQKRFAQVGHVSLWIMPDEAAGPGHFSLKWIATGPHKEVGYRASFLFGLFSGTIGSGLQVGLIASTIETIFAEWVAGVFGLLAGLIFTAFSVPGMLEKGNVEILLSKPISRITLLLYKYLGGLTYVFLLSVILIGGSWLAISLRMNYWNTTYLWSIGILTFQFAILYSISVLFAVLWRSWLGSILMTTVSWFGFWAVNWIHQDVIHNPILAGKIPDWVTSVGDLLYFILPKTRYLDKLNNEMLRKSHATDELMKALAGTVHFPPGVSWESAIISSAIFTMIILALACWRFSRKDY